MNIFTNYDSTSSPSGGITMEGYMMVCKYQFDVPLCSNKRPTTIEGYMMLCKYQFGVPLCSNKRPTTISTPVRLRSLQIATENSARLPAGKTADPFHPVTRGRCVLPAVQHSQQSDVVQVH
jgi:hypothetical protein